MILDTYSFEFFNKLLFGHSLPNKLNDFVPFSANQNLALGSVSKYYTPAGDSNATYSALGSVNWFYGNLWVNPYLSSFTSGTSNLDVSLASHDRLNAPVKFPLVKRAAVAAVDLTYPDRVYMENVLFTSLFISHDNANAIFTVPFLFNGFKLIMR